MRASAAPSTKNGSGFFRSERRYGTFRREIPLPEGVNAEQVTASFKDGVLEVSMPAPQRQTRGRRIEIQSGTPSHSSTPSGAEHQASSHANQEHAQQLQGEPNLHCTEIHKHV